MTSNVSRKTARTTVRAAQSHRTRTHLKAWIFLAPALALFVFVFVIPIAYTLWESFLKSTSTNGTGFGPKAIETTFAWFENYTRAFTDPNFIASIGRVALLGVIQVPLMLIFALVLALLLDGRRPVGRRTFSLMYFLPYAVPGVVGALMWAFLVQPSLSPFTAIAESFGIPLDLTSQAAIPFTIGNMIVWGFTGYNMVIIYAALQAIPREIFEAAIVDGAGAVRIALRIKIPLVRPALILTAVFSIIGTIQLYNEPEVLHISTANVDPSFSPLMAIYASVQNNDLYGAASRSIILAVIALAFSFGFLRLQQRRGKAFE